jgi:hypothetical protein
MRRVKLLLSKKENMMQKFKITRQHRTHSCHRLKRLKTTASITCPTDLGAVNASRVKPSANGGSHEPDMSPESP